MAERVAIDVELAEEGPLDLVGGERVVKRVHGLLELRRAQQLLQLARLLQLRRHELQQAPLGIRMPRQNRRQLVAAQERAQSSALCAPVLARAGAACARSTAGLRLQKVGQNGLQLIAHVRRASAACCEVHAQRRAQCLGGHCGRAGGRR